MLRPAPIASSLPAKQNRQLIVDALSTRGWVVESEEPGAIVAYYSRAQHKARVRIGYGGGSIQIAYLDSQNLKCSPAPEGGCTSIHRAYNRWVNNLHHDIAMRVGAGG
jgi:hypothetical protein